jgi:serine/threonine protein kinase
MSASVDCLAGYRRHMQGVLCLLLYVQVIGSPTEADMGFVTSDKARRYLRSLPKNPRSDFRQLYPQADPHALDLLDKMLVFDPAKRISVQEALSHPWLEALHDESDEPVADVPFTFDVPGHLQPQAAAALMLKEVQRFHPEMQIA